ncbi:Ubiquitin fusion degradation 1 isoform 2 [Hibiscus syriacus]|uniref:Ubiquitin fusion degradation 1 isoform 2 n=1 Tax=Hibiscus syriacus TaxID=106335 RepID=A0A6A3AP76_HIBSY|nr:Ubiquitin fusion degradation 1 isoform 2 [Hibiscus syriacus]
MVRLTICSLPSGFNVNGAFEYNRRTHKLFLHCRTVAIQLLNSIIDVTLSLSLIRSLQAHLEKGDKVLMPASALDRLSKCTRTSFFNMHLEEGDIVQVKSASLANATYVKLQPHTTDFLDILETTEELLLLNRRRHDHDPYNNKNYYINIVETKPYPAVSIETDCKVDFAPPLDYKEIEKPSPPLQSNKKLKGIEEEPPRKRIPFSGSARRLDGKPAAPLLKHYHSDVGSETVASKSSSSTSSQRAWKLVFGSNGNWPQNETEKVAMRNSQDRSKRKSQLKPSPGESIH